MKRTTVPMLGAACATGAALADFLHFFVTTANVTTGGQALTVNTLWARFNGPTDTVLSVFNLAAGNGTSLTGYWNKDNAYYNSGVLSQEFGTWNPSQTGSITASRPFDSYLTIGGLASAANTTNADPSWVSRVAGLARETPAVGTAHTSPTTARLAGSTRIRRTTRVASGFRATQPRMYALASSWCPSRPSSVLNSRLGTTTASPCSAQTPA